MLQPKKRKLSKAFSPESPPMSIINPTDNSSHLLLNHLLQSNRVIAVFKKNTDYALLDGSRVQLTHTLVVRDILGTTSDLCYFVLSNKRYPDASYAIIYELAGMVTFKLTEQAFFYSPLTAEQGEWIFKEFGGKKNKPLSLLTPLTMVEDEAAISRHFPHLKASPVLGGNDRRYIMMNKFKGCELIEVINEGIRGRALSADQRIELSLLLIQALWNQIHKDDWVHRDVKPENIIVDTSVTPFQVTFIDVAFTVKNNTLSTAKVSGTANYIAPELYKKGTPITFKSDVYGLGRALQLLWGFYKWHPDYDKDYDQTLRLPEGHRIPLIKALELTTMHAPDKRVSLPALERFFVKLCRARSLLPSLTEPQTVSNVASSHVSSLLTPYAFFKPKNIVNSQMLSKVQFKALLEKSCQVYMREHPHGMALDYIEAVSACDSLSEFVCMIMAHKKEKGEIFHPCSLVCLFLNEANQNNQINSITFELMIDELSVDNLLLHSGPGESCVTDTLLSCLVKPIVHDPKGESERNKLFEYLERYVAYQKADHLERVVSL